MSTDRLRRGAPLIVLVAVIVAATACQPTAPKGAVFGNQIAGSCPQYQAATNPPCGPQPMLWASMSGPLQRSQQRGSVLDEVPRRSCGHQPMGRCGVR